MANKISRYIDLTMPINEKIPVYPGDPRPKFTRVARLEKEGWNEHRITINTHLGTHIDAPWHMLHNGKRLSDFQLGRFIGNCTIINVKGRGEVDVDIKSVGRGDMVFLRSNHTKLIYTREFFEHKPVLSMRLAKKLVRAGVSVVGFDSYTVDDPPFPVHKYLLKHDVLIVENLYGLDKIKKKSFRAYIMPIKLDRIDGAPCRVVAETT